MKIVVGWGDGSWKYGVSFDGHVPTDVKEWCLEMFDPDRCHVGYWNVAFKKEVDRNWFILRWA